MSQLNVKIVINEFNKILNLRVERKKKKTENILLTWVILNEMLLLREEN